MSLVKSKAIQLGFDATPTNNFLIYQPLTPDGTFRIANGNQGATTDIMTVTSGGSVTFAGTTNFSSLNFAAGSESAPSLFPTGDSNTGIWFPAADTFAVSTGGTQRLRITSSGSVGINTSSPSGVFHVSQTSGSMYIDVAGGIPRMRLGGGNGFGFNRISASEDIFFGEPSDTGTWRVRGAGTISLGAGDTGTTMTIGGNNGNVGIGTTSPSSKLHVSGLTTIGAATVDSNWNSQLLINGNATYNPKQVFASTTGYRWSIRNNDVGGNGQFAIRYEEGSIDALAIDRSGKVGINNTSPSALLQIGAPYDITGAVKHNALIIGGRYSNNSSTPNQYQVMSFIGTTAATDDIFTHTSGEVMKNYYVGLVTDNAYFNANRFAIIQGGAERLTIQGYGTNAGFIGIGTGNPQAKLHIGSGWVGIHSDITTSTAVPAWISGRITGEIHAGAGVNSGSDGGVLRLSAGGENTETQKSGIDLAGYNTTDGGPTVRVYAGGEKLRIAPSQAGTRHCITVKGDSFTANYRGWQNFDFITFNGNRWLLLWPKSSDGAYFIGTLALTNYTQPCYVDVAIHNAWNNVTNMGLTYMATRAGTASISLKRVTYGGVQWVALYNGGETNREVYFQGVGMNMSTTPIVVSSVTTDHETYASA